MGQIESVMDTIVEGYYAGFNKSIHNYSLILTLFIQAKDTCASIQGMLRDAAAQLAQRQKNLASQVDLGWDFGGGWAYILAGAGSGAGGGARPG